MRVKKSKYVSVIDRSVEMLEQSQKIREIKDEDAVKPVQDFKTLAEQVAKSTVFFKNVYIDELRETYKYFDRMKRIDKVFPYAKINNDGPTEKLYVDEPVSESDVNTCFEKVKIMKRLGHKYLVIEKDTLLIDALEQLGVI